MNGLNRTTFAAALVALALVVSTPFAANASDSSGLPPNIDVGLATNTANAYVDIGHLDYCTNIELTACFDATIPHDDIGAITAKTTSSGLLGTYATNSVNNENSTTVTSWGSISTNGSTRGATDTTPRPWRCLNTDKVAGICSEVISNDLAESCIGATYTSYGEHLVGRYVARNLAGNLGEKHGGITGTDSDAGEYLRT